tara:strand:+ start:368 stop:637 length:270 start_codon:yes stop_codon:yes gene_type:complete
MTLRVVTTPDMDTIYVNSPTINYRDHAIRLLAQGYSDEFAEFCAGDDRMHELMQDLATEFVDRNIPIVDEDASVDTAYELFMNVTVTKV